jgi:hypothetical protein
MKCFEMVVDGDLGHARRDIGYAELENESSFAVQLWIETLEKDEILSAMSIWIRWGARCLEGVWLVLRQIGRMRTTQYISAIWGAWPRFSGSKFAVPWLLEGLR